MSQFIDDLLEVHKSGRCRGGKITEYGITPHTEECKTLVDLGHHPYCNLCKRRHGGEAAEEHLAKLRAQR